MVPEGARPILLPLPAHDQDVAAAGLMAVHQPSEFAAVHRLGKARRLGGGCPVHRR